MVVGLTGGIGSGKTTVAQLFSILDIPIYSADDRAKRILGTDMEVQDKVKVIFGANSIVNGVVNRKLIAKASFGNKEKLERLNAVIHPAVAEDFANWKKENEQAEYLIKEAAILFESGSYVGCDKIILVCSPLETRIERVMKRDSASRVEVESRISNQWPEDKKRFLSDYIVLNDEKSSLIKQAVEIHEKILNENS